MGNIQQPRTMNVPGTFMCLLVCILCEGCVVFPYPTPEVKGLVIDAATKKPIAGAKVAIRKHATIFCETSANGNFDLPANHIWGPCFLMPGDYLVIARLLFSAAGYQPFTNDYLGGYHGKPVVLEHPIELKKEL